MEALFKFDLAVWLAAREEKSRNPPSCSESTASENGLQDEYWDTCYQEDMLSRFYTLLLFSNFNMKPSVGEHWCKCRSFALDCTTFLTKQQRMEKFLFFDWQAGRRYIMACSVTDLITLVEIIIIIINFHGEKQTRRKIHSTKNAEKCICCIGHISGKPVVTWLLPSLGPIKRQSQYSYISDSLWILISNSLHVYKLL